MKRFMTEIVGNDALCSRLGQDTLFDTLPHALIIEGRRGTGKHTIAKMTAAALACSNKGNESLPLPCLECIDCRKVLENKSPDVITLGRDGKATLGVDTIRFIKEDIHIIPNDLEHKIYIIEDADKMTLQAQNALLLSLEEPPSFVRFILLCEDADALLETIRSRAPIFRTRPIPNDVLSDHICSKDRRAAQMKLSDPQGFDELIVSSENGIGTALEYLDPKIFAPKKSARAFVSEFIETVIQGGSYGSSFSIISRFSQKREVLEEQLSLISLALRDLIILKKRCFLKIIKILLKKYSLK